MTLYCHFCRKLNPGYAQFCARCGQNLDAPSCTYQPPAPPATVQVGGEERLRRPNAAAEQESTASRRDLPYGFDLKSRPRPIPPVPPIGRTLNKAEMKRLSRPPRARSWLGWLAVFAGGIYAYGALSGRSLERVSSEPSAAQWRAGSESQVFHVPYVLREAIYRLLAADDVRVLVMRRDGGFETRGSRDELRVVEAFVELATCPPAQYASKYRRSRSGLLEVPQRRAYTFDSWARAKAFASVLEMAPASGQLAPRVDRTTVQVSAAEYEHHVINAFANLVGSR